MASQSGATSWSALKVPSTLQRRQPSGAPRQRGITMTAGLGRRRIKETSAKARFPQYHQAVASDNERTGGAGSGGAERLVQSWKHWHGEGNNTITCRMRLDGLQGAGRGYPTTDGVVVSGEGKDTEGTWRVLARGGQAPPLLNTLVTSVTSVTLVPALPPHPLS